MQTLVYTPGQKVTIFLEILDLDGYRVNPSLTPSVSRIFLPDLTLSLGFPLDMIQVDVGLYTFQFTLPTGALAVGSYLIDVEYINPISDDLNTKLYQVICNAPFGNFGIAT